MMILRSSPPSPFGRKVKLAVGILGLDKDMTIEKADPTDANDTIRKQNPIGKIPALIIEDGAVFYNSPVILEYLDHHAGGGKIIPKDPSARFAALTCKRCAMASWMPASSGLRRALASGREARSEVGRPSAGKGERARRRAGS